MSPDPVGESALFRPDMVARAGALIQSCRIRGWRLATAESCTGGLVAALLTEIAGSSAVVDRGFVTYSNEAKAELLGVSWDLLETDGAVSEATARAMALGALNRSLADAAVAITGIAGPGGGSAEKPVGLVHFAVANRGRTTIHAACRFGAIGRLAVRLASVEQALAMLQEAVAEP